MSCCSSKKLYDDGGRGSRRCVSRPGIMTVELLNRRLLLVVPNSGGLGKSIGTKFHCFTSVFRQDSVIGQDLVVG